MPGRRPLPAPPRLRVLTAIREGRRTVNDLAATLGVTDNAVRGHITALIGEGLVRRRGSVRSGIAGKPAEEFEVTAAAEVALSRAYAPALEALVTALAEQLDPRALRAALRAAGRRLVPAGPRPASLASSAAAARALLTGLGGSARIERAGSRSHADVLGDGCPLGAAVARVPATCTIVEEMLAAHTGRRVEQRCAHGDRPRCSFRISSAAER